MISWKIMAWSALGGMVQGLIYGVLAVGVAVLLGETGLLAVVGLGNVSMFLLIILVIVPPLIGALLGGMEGALKARRFDD